MVRIVVSLDIFYFYDEHRHDDEIIQDLMILEVKHVIYKDLTLKNYN